MFYESNIRSLSKAVSYRILGSLMTFGLVWLFTRQVVLAAGVGALEILGKMALFYVHERAWDRIRFGRRQIQPAVIWLTGLSGSGKSTLASRVAERLRRRGHACEHLDGDTIRSVLPGTGFTRAERDAHVRRVGYLASRLEANGTFVVVSLISPYGDSRNFVRGLCSRFLEIHIATPLSECERRDTKGLYARARRGQITAMTGIDDPYEPPGQAELVLDTTILSIEDAAARVMALIDQ